VCKSGFQRSHLDPSILLCTALVRPRLYQFFLLLKFPLSVRRICYEAARQLRFSPSLESSLPYYSTARKMIPSFLSTVADLSPPSVRSDFSQNAAGVDFFRKSHEKTHRSPIKAPQFRLDWSLLRLWVLALSLPSFLRENAAPA